MKECGADVNAVDKQGNTALMIALRFGNLDTASCLVTGLEADSSAANLAGASCLHFAAVLTSVSWADEEEEEEEEDEEKEKEEREDQEEKAMKMVELLIRRGGIDLVSKTDSNFGRTPLHYALYVRNEALAGMLAEQMCHGDTSGSSDQLWRARHDLLDQQRQGPLALWRGLPCDAKLGPDEGLVEFCAFSTLRSAYSCPPGGKAYFEVEIMEIEHLSKHSYGFATAAFERVPGATKNGLGHDNKSWQVNGKAQIAMYDGEEKLYECAWNPGDVVGLACDLDKWQVLVSVNGSFEAPNGLIFELTPDAAQDGIFGALSGQSGKVRCNLGQTPFKHSPPSAEFKAFVHFQ